VEIERWRCEEVEIERWRCEEVEIERWRCEDREVEESYPVSSDVDLSGEPVSRRTEGPPDVPGFHHLHQVGDDLVTGHSSKNTNTIISTTSRPSDSTRPHGRCQADATAGLASPPDRPYFLPLKKSNLRAGPLASHLLVVEKMNGRPALTPGGLITLQDC